MRIRQARYRYDVYEVSVLMVSSLKNHLTETSPSIEQRNALYLEEGSEKLGLTQTRVISTPLTK